MGDRDPLRRATLDLIDAAHSFLDALAAVVDADDAMVDEVGARVGHLVRGLVTGFAGSPPTRDDEDEGGVEPIRVG